MQSSGSRISQSYVKVPEHARRAAFRRFFDLFLLPNKINRTVTIADFDIALEAVRCLSGSFRINVYVESFIS
jgi:hypothetical protein